MREADGKRYLCESVVPLRFHRNAESNPTFVWEKVVSSSAELWFHWLLTQYAQLRSHNHAGRYSRRAFCRARNIRRWIYRLQRPQRNNVLRRLSNSASLQRERRSGESRCRAIDLAFCQPGRSGRRSARGPTNALEDRLRRLHRAALVCLLLFGRNDRWCRSPRQTFDRYSRLGADPHCRLDGNARERLSPGKNVGKVRFGNLDLSGKISARTTLIDSFREFLQAVHRASNPFDETFPTEKLFRQEKLV